jgi:hypothetical protein
MTLSLLIALGKFADLKASSQVPAPKSPTDVEATAK